MIGEVRWVERELSRSPLSHRCAAVAGRPHVIAAIADAFDSVITTSSYHDRPGSLGEDPLDYVDAPDPRVLVHSPWAQLDPVYRPPAVFDASGRG